MLDTNVFDLLAADPPTQLAIRDLVIAKKVRVLATPKIRDELTDSPLEGLPDWFPIELEPESVAVSGHARSGMARLGEGKIFKAHKGESCKAADGIIADSANSLADIVVSEDGRFLRRFQDMSERCQGMSYEQFCKWLSVAGASGEEQVE